MEMGGKRRRVFHPCQIVYGDTPIVEASSYTHLGTIQSPKGKQPYDVDEVRQSIRTTYFSVVPNISGSDGANPLMAAKLYTSCVLPRALFACELWNSISTSDLHELEVSHHICLKNAQGLPYLTRSDMVTGLFGFTSIEAFIDLQKLIFLRTLCTTPSSHLLHTLFNLRLFHFNRRNTNVHRSFAKYKQNIRKV